jgi:hypothetical protein
MINAEDPKWEPSNSTMGNIENSAILTVAELSLGDRRSALREVNALFQRLRRDVTKEEEAPVLPQDFF